LDGTVWDREKGKTGKRGAKHPRKRETSLSAWKGDGGRDMNLGMEMEKEREREREREKIYSWS